MDKEFYEFLYNLRASGFTYPTKETTRQMLFLSKSAAGNVLQQLSYNNGSIQAQHMDGEVGNLSDEAIVNCRNMLISVAVTMNMIATDSYVDHQTANSLCDFYIQKAEGIRSIGDFESLTQSMFQQFHDLFNQKLWPSYGRLLDQCVDYIHQRLYSPLTVQEVADHVGYSPTYLTTLFREKSGMTLYSFIQLSKIHEAQKALLCTNQPLSSIASALGYHSLSHFSKAFKSAVGISPLQYRRLDPIKREQQIDLSKSKKKNGPQ